MSTDESKKEFFNGNYVTPKEEKKIIEDRAKKNKFLSNMANKARERGESLTDDFMINGKIYNSIRHAANDLGVSDGVIRKRHKQLMKTQMSSIETEIQVTKTFIFKKVKNG